MYLDNNGKNIFQSISNFAQTMEKKWIIIILSCHISKCVPQFFFIIVCFCHLSNFLCDFNARFSFAFHSAGQVCACAIFKSPFNIKLFAKHKNHSNYNIIGFILVYFTRISMLKRIANFFGVFSNSNADESK